MRCRLALALAMVAFPIAAIAQIPPSEQPGRERERFIEPPVPRAQPRGPVVTLPSTVAPEGAARIALTIKDVRIVGGTVYTAEQLRETYAGFVGQRVTLQTVYDIAQRITAKYGKDGYVLSRAVVPPQQLSPRGAVVRIQIVEGYIDKVEWPAAVAKYRDFFSAYAAKIIADRPANIRSLERYLLLASDLPGLKFRSSIKPSPTGTRAATLVLELAAAPLDALLRLDAGGAKARGPVEFLASATVNNMLRIHEAFTVSFAGAQDLKELRYLAASYRQVLNSEGLTFFANASHGWGRPSVLGLMEFDYRTLSTLFEAGLAYPVIRAREKNLTATGLWFWTRDESTLAPNTILTLDRMTGFRVKLDGDLADSLRGINQINLVFSQGLKGPGRRPEELPSRAAGRTDFSKLEGTVSRLQQLAPYFSVLGVAYGQYAMTPLLASELCGYGGRQIGRAFDPSEMTADSCWQILGEARLDLPGLFPGLSKDVTQLQLYAYADRGHLHNLAIDPTSGTPIDVDGASVGGGLRTGWMNAFTADLSVAKAVKGPRNDWRFFFILALKH